ncbi:phosphotransferase family protein [Micromonospora sp. NBC_00389]|uniref:phosphotransferase family protein n=1 Tax=Micromonospora sp. NBC_00389 TaxID=2903586 RepID=UPI002E1C3644
MATSTIDLNALVHMDRLAPALAQATGQDAWHHATATLIAGGKSNLTFELASPVGALILRRPPTGDLLPSAHDMAREAQVQAALKESSVPVPQVVLRDDGDLLGVPCYVMNKVAGHVIRERMPAHYADSADQKAAIADALVDVLVALHQLDPEQVGLRDYGRPRGFLERQLRRWSGQWEVSRTHEVPAVTELARRLQHRLPTTPRTAIVHGDYRLDNCVMNLDDPGRVEAVLDWELSTLGDPLTDLGMLLFYWGDPGDPAPLLTPAVTRTAGFPPRSRLAQRYGDATGVALDDLAFYEAFAHLKFAVIAQGIASRVAAGAMAGQDFGNLDDEVLRIAETGLLRLDERE